MIKRFIQSFPQQQYYTDKSDFRATGHLCYFFRRLSRTSPNGSKSTLRIRHQMHEAFKSLPAKLDFAKMEEETLVHWKNIDVFHTSLKQSMGRKMFSFYDGPPFATGLPHYGHILAGTIKDIVCRYAHQTGHHVERRFGWDCHGLPIEFEIEKKLGIKSSHDVQKMGIKAYNAECRSIVTRFVNEWEQIVTRCGRWIDFKNDYKTMNLSYMESVWWVFKQLHEKNMVYRGYRVMPYSTSCTTPLSNFEANMNYKDVSDPSAMVTFPLIGVDNTHFLAWTTTPWTLPSNLALVVNPAFDYVKVRDMKSGMVLVFAECRLDDIYKNHAKAKEKPFEKLGTIKGSELAGTEYIPLFNFFENLRTKGAFRVVADTYVTDKSGTGVVHAAPGFGEDDYRVCIDNKIIEKSEIVCPVDENGCFTDDVPPYKGRAVKECDDEICKEIKSLGRLFRKEAIVHSYPFCWRSETPLIYRAIDSWFINVEMIKDKLLKSNEETYWVPDSVKTKRFTNWLQDARDWNVSRNRYWGCPLPVWHSDDWEEIVVIGSIAELEALCGVTGITDIHRDSIDHLTIPSKREGVSPLKRVPEVFDCWFESGSMPYAQQHYPFENKETFEKIFPANFIAEGLDQTRGWFYTLIVLSTALFEKAPFQNLIVNGLVLAADGKKMSKRLNNYPPVTDVINKYGADAVRLFLINSPVVRGEPLRFSEEGVKKVVTDLFIPLSNAVKFFVMNANRLVSEHSFQASLNQRSTNEMDRWILAVTGNLVGFIHREMKKYRLDTVVPGVVQFLDTLTNWYVRMNRRRLKGAEGLDDWKQSISTLFQVLNTTTLCLAPFTPFLAESIYQCFAARISQEEGADSIHYLMLPEEDVSNQDAQLERNMGHMISVVDLVRVVRDRSKGFGSLKMPFRRIIVIHPDSATIEGLRPLEKYIKREVNTFGVVFTSDESEYVICKLEANFKVLGKRLGKDMQTVKNALKEMAPAEVTAFLSNKGATVCNHELSIDDVTIVRDFKEGISEYETNTNGEVLVLVDVKQDSASIDSFRAREFVSRIQKLRKDTGLEITDIIDIWFESDDTELVESLQKCRDQINETITVKWGPKSEMPTDAAVVQSREEDISGGAISITFTRPC